MNSPKRLKALLPATLTQGLSSDPHITGLKIDSRDIQNGDLFVAYPGVLADGRDYIDAAIQNGASAVLAEAFDSGCEPESTVPVIAVKNVKGLIGSVAANFFDHASQKMKVVAVTGTNGKTSLTQMIAQAMDFLTVHSAVIGTLGNGIVGNLKTTANTTPDAVLIQQLMAEFLADNVEVLAIEASSHGLKQDRLKGTSIDIGVVTNITRDHLDYHGTMTAYKDAKSQLVEWPELKYVILNADDKEVMSLAKRVKSDVDLMTFSLNSKLADIYVEALTYKRNGLLLTVKTPAGLVDINNNLMGAFNVENLLAAVAVLLCLDKTCSDISRALSAITQIPGRMEEVRLPVDTTFLPTVIVDFAHTPDALEKVLKALRYHSEGNLWCVFGCGGDRDKGKRPEMGEIATRCADRVVITSDNPRTEDPESIVQEIENGIGIGAAYSIELDRAAAVEKVIAAAAPGDVVLLAGKGHENYQECHGKKISYNDIETAQQILQRKQNSIEHQEC